MGGERNSRSCRDLIAHSARPSCHSLSRAKILASSSRRGKGDRYAAIAVLIGSRHVQSGTSLMVLKELGGWETIEMVQKYAHLDVGHLANMSRPAKYSHDLVTVAKQTTKKPLKQAANLLILKAFSGPPGWTRTSDQRIMSPLL